MGCVPRTCACGCVWVSRRALQGHRAWWEYLQPAAVHLEKRYAAKKNAFVRTASQASPISRIVGTSVSRLTIGPTTGLILIGECFFQKFQSLEIIGDMYWYTEAFCHYSWNSPEEAKISSSLTFQYLEQKKNRNIWKIEKLREKNIENLDKKLSDKNDR